MKRYFKPSQILLVIFAVMIILPVLIMFFSTFKTKLGLAMDPLGWPNPFTFDNYKLMFDSGNILTYFKNSIIVTFFTVLFIIFFASMLSHAIVRIGGWKGDFLFGLLVLGMLIPAQVNMIPLYGLVSNIEAYSASISWMPDIQLRNSLIGLIFIKTAVLISICVFILTGFMRTLPKELFEAASVDGASEWWMYYKVSIPLSLPSIATSGIFLSVIVWNDLLYPLLFINDDNMKTLPLALLRFSGEYETNFSALFAGVTLASLPMVVAYLFFQRWFIAGMTAGSIKG